MGEGGNLEGFILVQEEQDGGDDDDDEDTANRKWPMLIPPRQIFPAARYRLSTP